MWPFSAEYRKIILHYLYGALFCGLFALVYEHFSHAVYSKAMIFMFLYPLAGGCLAYSFLALCRLKVPSLQVRDLYAAGLITLTVGSCFQGVLEIYGTASYLLGCYWISGGILIISALSLAVRDYLKKAKKA